MKIDNLNNADGYKEYCEQLYQSWLKGSDCFQDFRSNFEPDYLPEPYLTFGKGEKVLCVLNYNPGQPLKNKVQSREVIIRNYPKQNYQKIAELMANYYRKELKDLVYQAWYRFERMIEFASNLGYDSVENLESFFLHSKQINARSFLKKYSDNQQVKKYKELLKDHLKDMPVLAITAVGSNQSVTIETLKSDAWILYLCDVISMKLDNAKIIPVTIKNGKTTSCIVANGNKYLSVAMGSNKLVMPSEKQFKDLRK